MPTNSKKIVIIAVVAAVAVALLVIWQQRSTPPKTASAEDIKIGVILGFTGPIESLTPGMADSAELAMKEVSDSGLLLGGRKVTPVRS